MSNWNNSYSYNPSHHQDQNSWQADQNRQYIDQGPNFYSNQQYTQNGQYVSFNEFLSQIQPNGAGPSNNYQYQNYGGQINYPGVSNQNPSQNHMYDAPSNDQPNAQNQAALVQPETSSTYDKETVSKSKLTATATEFVPKNSQNQKATNNVEPYTSKQDKPRYEKNERIHSKKEGNEPNRSHHEVNGHHGPRHLYENNRNPKKYGSRSNTREYDAGQSSRSNAKEYNAGQSFRYNAGQSSRSNARDYDAGQSSRPNTREYDADRSSKPNSREYDADRSSRQNARDFDASHNSRPNARDYDAGQSSRPNTREYDADRSSKPNSREYDADRSSRQNARDFDASHSSRPNARDYDAGQSSRPNTREYDADRSSRLNPRDFDAGQSSRPNARDYDAGQSSRPNTREYDTDRNSKPNAREYDADRNSRPNARDPDAGRTFYNSKSSQDVRNGGRFSDSSNNRNRHWPGSQRIHIADRNTVEDEQYANNYHQQQQDHKDDNEEKIDKNVKTQFSPMRNKSKPSSEKNKELTQRERLTEQLDRGGLECLVCCDRVKQFEAVWSCGTCYHVFHLRCIKKWAKSSLHEGKWRCPACQTSEENIPVDYFCMCGTLRNPENNYGIGAHTCGMPCSRTRSCKHPCTLLCHPGPCPQCQATIEKYCGCGAEKRSILCSSKLEQVCDRTCDKLLACTVHRCKRSCHVNSCDECVEIVKQVCHCPAGKTREMICTQSTADEQHFACGDACGRVLSCGAHVCRQLCHPPPCPPCALLPENVLLCPCGHTKIEKDQRKLCTDPIPLCGNICAKPLSCGPAGDEHFCKQECHEGPCPPCPDKTVVNCRCGHINIEVPCSELPQKIGNVFCQKKCNKKMGCGRHRCRERCCATETHECLAMCGRLLTCQSHRCQMFCHMGHCSRCPIYVWEEISCECGQEVLFPPVPCGARAPPCSSDCTRTRPCGHPPHHSCHIGECPPCVVQTTKSCHGGHEERKTILCSQEDFSCGLPCGKPLPCGKHTCIKICHKGPCDTEKCTQPCQEKRPSCGHPCGAVCHAGEGASPVCPSSTPCRRLVNATCSCRRRVQQRSCAENARDLAKIMNTLAAVKIQEGGGTVDLAEVTRPVNSLKTLECDDECRLEARTRQMALALQIRNPDVSSKLAPRYSDHVRQWATRDPTFAQHIHNKMTELVQLAKKSKQKTRSHSFPSMNWQKRQFIHELCEHFGCESVAYDAEPNRNVVATADKEKSWLPAMSVLEVLSREAGKRRVPPPVMRANVTPATTATVTTNNAATTSTRSTTGWASSANSWAARAQQKPKPSEPPKRPVIDYFDNPPED